MWLVIFITFLFSIAGYYLFVFVFDIFFPKTEKSKNPLLIYIDRSKHYYDHRQVHLDGDVITANSDKSTIDD